MFSMSHGCEGQENQLEFLFHLRTQPFNPTMLSTIPYESGRVVLTVSIPEGCKAGLSFNKTLHYEKREA